MNEETLKSIGLSPGEIKVYLSILKTGPSTINQITEKTGLERRGIYDIINKLIERGLISYIKEGKKRVLRCSHPKKILDKTEEKIESLKKLERQVLEFTKIYEESKLKISAEVFRGKEGIKAVFEDMLNYKESFFIGGGYYIKDILPHYWPQYNKRRIKLKIKWYNLAIHEVKKKESLGENLIHTKFLPKGFSITPSVIFIYGNKVANVLWDEDFFAFVIESKAITDNYRKYHKYIWNKIAKP